MTTCGSVGRTVAAVAHRLLILRMSRRNVVLGELSTRPGGTVTLLARRLTLGICAVAAFAALLSMGAPSLRHQAALTATRQPESFLELAFLNPELARSCAIDDDTLAVQVQVAAHGARAGEVPVEFAVVTEATGVHHQRTRQINAVVDERIDVIETLPVPPVGPFTVVAKIANGTERISVRCRI